MVKREPGRPRLPQPHLIMLRLRGTALGELLIRGEPSPKRVAVDLARYYELMDEPLNYAENVIIELDKLCNEVPQKATGPRGVRIELDPVDPLYMNMIDAWWCVASRGYLAQEALAQYFDARIDVTGLGLPKKLSEWCKLLDGLIIARNHPEYASDPVAAYRAAGLCA